ncbi:site-specific integrase [Pseudoalteromonas distincta]|uniref:site-specific integrase n=1 Tax=Pseudoalteromonas distincta TaxID=77608 RepID=UPI00186A5016|nr:site-specific integrase [Pseudoalteromonas distincta]MBE3672521.1 hypothetical protein [Pseudoalteromonas distincta KMM 3548]
MNKRFKFTDKLIQSLPAHIRDSRATEAEYSDTDITGLKCLIGKTGNRRFLFRYTFHSRKYSISLGKFGDIKVSDAKRIAQKHRVTLLEGRNPKVERDEHTHMTLNDFFFNHYLPLVRKRKRTWQDDLYRWHRIIEPQLGSTPLCELRTLDVQRLHIELADTKHKYGKTYAPATCNQVLLILKAITRYALEAGVIDEDVCKPIKLYKLNNARTRFLTKFEVKRLLKECKAYSNKVIAGYIATLALTGLRCSEVSNIKVKDMDIKNRVIHIPHTKNGKPRTVYITDTLLGFIGAIPLQRNNPYLFASKVEGKPLKSARKTFKKLLINAKIDPSDVCLHTLRHSVASNLVSAGVSLRLVQEQLSHASIVSTQRYAKLTSESMRNTSEQLAHLFK